jgi:uncharacterized protein YjbI with pentapeptide repeats
VPIRTVRDLMIELPTLDGGGLKPVNAPWSGNLHDAYVGTGSAVRSNFLDARLRRSHLEHVDFTETVWEDVAAVGCTFERVDLSAARLTGVTIERCHFIGCTFTFANLAETTLDNVLFESCRLNNATLTEVRTIGPTAFVGSVLVNAVVRDSSLRQMALQGCRLRQITFDDVDLRGADLRGNRIAEIIGLASLRGIVIEPAQLADLTDAVIRDLEVDVRGPAS